MPANILLVDDDTMFRTLTGSMLDKCGYMVETAVDGQAAWELLDAAPGHFDLVLLDRHMPNLDGLELLKRLKADSRMSGIPVVMLTVNNRQDEVTRGLSEGAYHYLIKPASKELLDAVLRSVLDDLRAKRQLQEQAGRYVLPLKLLHHAEFSIRTLQEARDMAVLLAEISRDAPRSVGGFLELLINAIEHGNLGISYAEKSRLLSEDRWVEEVNMRLQQPEYASRFVEVTVDRTDTTCTVTIADQGDGFDWLAYLNFNPARAFDLHGRGIAMSRAASFDSLEYRGNGNIVAVSINKPAELLA
ncbi:MAG: response regulator [Sideroxydans sp.]|jgi:DNA-binding response OmpR family regulator